MKALARFTLIVLLLCTASVFKAKAETDSLQIPQGVSILPIPYAAYDADLGAQFGAILLIYDYGKNLFPQYRNKVYLNGCVYTSMAGAVKLTYDSGREFHKMRFTAHTRYSHEESGAFYGFNGSLSNVNNDWANVNSSAYKSKLFYSVRSNQFRFITDLSLELVEKVKFVCGTSSWFVQLDEPNVSFYRNFTGKNIPSTSEMPTLWNRYTRLGILPDNELHGGWCNYLKLALMRDSRDFEPNPHQGSRTELLLNVAPWGVNRWPHTKLTASHSVFIPIDKKFTLAMRGVFQTTLFGHAPYFVQPYIHSALGFSSITGLGGSETLRGISQNRIVADGILLGNAELRWRAINFTLFRRKFWLGNSLFVDAGRAVKSIDIDFDKVKQNAISQNIGIETMFTSDNYDRLHVSYGGGVKIGVNETTILSGDIAWPYSSQDGKMSLYLGVDFMF